MGLPSPRLIYMLAGTNSNASSPPTLSLPPRQDRVVSVSNHWRAAAPRRRGGVRNCASVAIPYSHSSLISRRQPGRKTVSHPRRGSKGAAGSSPTVCVQFPLRIKCARSSGCDAASSRPLRSDPSGPTHWVGPPTVCSRGWVITDY